MFPGFASSKGSKPSSDKGARTSPTLEVAHMLSVDIINYNRSASRELLDQMTQSLRGIAYSTPEFIRCNNLHETVCLTTDLGLTLVFFREILAPIRCASEIAFVLKTQAHIPVRIGIHSGPVTVSQSPDGTISVSGQEVATATKIMNLGDADHILISESVVEMMLGTDPWLKCLKKIGLAPVKSNRQLQIYNLCTRDFGNPNLPLAFVQSQEAEGARARRGEWLTTFGEGFWKGSKILGIVAMLAFVGWFAYPYAQKFFQDRAGLEREESKTASKPPSKRKPTKKQEVNASRPRTRRTIDRDNTPSEERSQPDRIIEDHSDAEPPKPSQIEPESTKKETPNEDGSNEKVHLFNLVLTIPQDQEGSRLVKVTCLDSRGLQPNVLEANFSEGERIPLQFEGAGKEVTLRVYFNDKLSKEWRLTPPSPSASPQEIR